MLLKPKKRSLIQYGLLLTGLLSLSLMLWRSFAAPDVPALIAPQAFIQDAREAPVYEERFASRELDQFVHAPTVAALDNGDLIAAWFAGSREGAKDVVIRATRFDASLGQWSEEQVLVTRSQTRDAVGRYIRKLGNPVLTQATDGKVWLFYVSVSVGGWAGSAINAMHSTDKGRTWSKPERLITSPFLNVSTLVRSPPVAHEGGVMGLPVYHEFLGKFPEYLLLDRNGRLLDKRRMGLGGRQSLQPAALALDQKQVVAVLRYAGDGASHLLGTNSLNAGADWSVPRPLKPNNPNSSAAVSFSGLSEFPILVAQNDLAQGRFRLSLHLVDQGLSDWRLVRLLDASPSPEGALYPIEDFRPVIREAYLAAADDGHRQVLDQALARLEAQMCKDGKQCDFDFEYPTMVTAADGMVHLVYAWNDTLIKHVRFNQAWLLRALNAANDEKAPKTKK